MPYVEVKNRTKTFMLDDETELLHIIKTGFDDKYMVVYEDAFEHLLGHVLFKSKEQIKTSYGIEI